MISSAPLAAARIRRVIDAAPLPGGTVVTVSIEDRSLFSATIGTDVAYATRLGAATDG